MEGDKKTKGKQKIEIKKIEKKDSRQVIFSKRKSGIVKKASELSTLCGAQVGFFIFSEVGNPHSYGHPSAESVAFRFLNQNQLDDPQANLDAQQLERINTASERYNQLVKQREAEKRSTKELEETRRAFGSNQGWWEKKVRELDDEQLQEFNASLDGFENLLKMANQRKMANHFVAPVTVESSNEVINPSGVPFGSIAPSYQVINQSATPSAPLSMGSSIEVNNPLDISLGSIAPVSTRSSNQVINSFGVNPNEEQPSSSMPNSIHHSRRF